MRLTFKKDPRPTGPDSYGKPKPNVQIKGDGKRCGLIVSPSYYTGYWRIQFSVTKKDINEDGNTNCTWRNKVLKAKFSKEDAAREFVKQHWEDIWRNEDLRFFDS